MLRKMLFGLTLTLTAHSVLADQATVNLCADMIQQQYQGQISQKQANDYCACSVPKMEALMDEAVRVNMPQSQINKRVKENAEYCVKKAGIAAKQQNSSAKNSSSNNSSKKTDSAQSNTNSKKTNNSTTDKKSKLMMPGLK
jgi:hypothetical protein